MGQVIGGASRKMKQRSAKSLQTTALCYFNAKSTLKVPLIFNKIEKTNMKFRFCSSLFFFHSFFLSFFLYFFLARHNLKSTWCMRILNMPNDCLPTCYILTCFEFHVAYNWQVMASKLSPKTLCMFSRRLLRLLFA